MIAAIFAVDEAGGIGNDGRLPWPHNKDDMTWFRETTRGQVVVMGRKTWDSPDLPKPLPNRDNIVFTNEFTDDLEYIGVEQVRGHVSNALRSIEKSSKKKTVFVIGGANLLKQAKPVIGKVYLTRIPGEYTCDTFIDLEDFLDGFELVDTVNHGSCVVEVYDATTA